MFVSTKSLRTLKMNPDSKNFSAGQNDTDWEEQERYFSVQGT